MIETTQDFHDLLQQMEEKPTVELLLDIMRETLENPHDVMEDLVFFCKKRSVPPFPATDRMILPIVTAYILGTVLLHDNIYINPHTQSVHSLVNAVNEQRQKSPLAMDKYQDCWDGVHKRGVAEGYKDIARLVAMMQHTCMIYATGDPNWHKLE